MLSKRDDASSDKQQKCAEFECNQLEECTGPQNTKPVECDEEELDHFLSMKLELAGRAEGGSWKG